MRDIYETAKKAQMAPVRGRVKAMMAQPRAVAQARKTARQTTGFKKGGVHKLNGSSLLKYDQIWAKYDQVCYDPEILKYVHIWSNIVRKY